MMKGSGRKLWPEPGFPDPLPLMQTRGEAEGATVDYLDN
jgi:hypothetical protein